MIGLQLSPPGDRVRGDLDAIRKKIAETHSGIEAAQEAPLRLDDAVERVLEDVRARMQHAENQLTHYSRPDGYVPENRARSHLDTLALLYQLIPEALEKGLRHHLKPACGNGLLRAERGPRSAEMRAKLATLLEREEELMAKLLLDGVVVERQAPQSAEGIERILRVWDSVSS